MISEAMIPMYALSQLLANNHRGVSISRWRVFHDNPLLYLKVSYVRSKAVPAGKQAFTARYAT